MRGANIVLRELGLPKLSVRGANIVLRELGLPKLSVRGTNIVTDGDLRFAFDLPD